MEQDLIERFVKERGFIRAWQKKLATYDPIVFERYLRDSSEALTKGPLPRKYAELIGVAVDAATTHLYKGGLRVHIRGALANGATKEEILQVLKIVALLGIHTFSIGIPILDEELERCRKEKI